MAELATTALLRPDSAVLPPHPAVMRGRRGDDEMLVTRQLLHRVANGELPPIWRLYEPGPTVAFASRETNAKGYAAATAAALRHGYTPVTRNAGGRAVAYGPGCLVVELLAPDPVPAARVDIRFTAFAGTIARALSTLGVDATVARLEGEYCPGDHSVIGAGRLKLAGVAQRIVAGAWLCAASLVVSEAARLRAVLVDVYGELGYVWRPDTLGAVADLAPEVTVRDIEAALAVAFGAETPAVPWTPA